jgi:branched-chain amino acid transport system permease protein
VLGGMGSLSGCVVGAVLVIGTERLLQRTSGPIYAWWPVEFPLLLALLIIFRPQGIFGRREITDLWRRTRSA